MLSATQSEIETSRDKLLTAIGGSSDITFIRIYGNVGDHLIYAGARRLFSGLRYKETSILDLSEAGGDLALIAGGGAWCAPYHDMPKHLPRVEQKFRRVIVLPSSFDVSVESVREALARTRALVFARERVSYEQIRGLCKADLAHDCAFFFDYSPYARCGAGRLHAYRMDAEARPGRIPADNRDISVSCETLDEWLWTIARHETVKTDRAHVMIAAAMLGKQVYYRASSYHKVPAIAEFALRALPVAPEEEFDTKWLRGKLAEAAAGNLASLPEDFLTRPREVEITVVMLSYRRLDQTINAIHALKENVAVPFKLLLMDNNSGADTQERLKEICAAYDFIELVLLDENLGCAAGRAYAVKRARTKYVLLIDNDIEVFPGSVEHLLNCLENNSQALAATGRVIFPDGTMHLCGGGYDVDDGVLNYELHGFGKEYDGWEGESGPCQWVPGCLTLLRREAMIDHPYDLGMRNYYEDLEWCYRLNRAGVGNFRRVVESVALHFHETKDLSQSLEAEERRRSAMKYLETIAYFYKTHGLVIPNIFHYVPELGTPSLPISRLSARLFLDLMNTHGSEWVLEKWNRGELAPLFSGGGGESEKRQAPETQERAPGIDALKKHEVRIAELEQSLLEIYQSKHWKFFDRYWKVRRSVLSLFMRDKSFFLFLPYALGVRSLEKTIAAILHFLGGYG
jgi:GT2 family glycosyltransferase/exopolysaccharide biosynthesis predicted pyruvyltransferase EpsI